MAYGGLEKELYSLGKDGSGVLTCPQRGFANTGVIVKWEIKGENSGQFQDKQYCLKKALSYLYVVLPWKVLFSSDMRAGSHIKQREMARMQAWNIPGLPLLSSIFRGGSFFMFIWQEWEKWKVSVTYSFHFPIEWENMRKIHETEELLQVSDNLLNEEWHVCNLMPIIALPSQHHYHLWMM